MLRGLGFKVWVKKTSKCEGETSNEQLHGSYDELCDEQPRILNFLWDLSSPKTYSF